MQTDVNIQGAAKTGYWPHRVKKTTPILPATLSDADGLSKCLHHPSPQ